MLKHGNEGDMHPHYLKPLLKISENQDFCQLLIGMSINEKNQY